MAAVGPVLYNMAIAHREKHVCNVDGDGAHCLSRTNSSSMPSDFFKVAAAPRTSTKY